MMRVLCCLALATVASTLLAGCGPTADSAPALAVRKDLIGSGRVKSFADLKGLTVTSAGLGSTTEIGLFSALARGGIAPSQVTYVTMSLGDVPAAFANHTIDAAMASEPFMAV